MGHKEVNPFLLVPSPSRIHIPSLLGTLCHPTVGSGYVLCSGGWDPFFSRYQLYNGTSVMLSKDSFLSLSEQKLL